MSKNNSNAMKLTYSYRSYSNQSCKAGYNPNDFCVVHQQTISQQFGNLFKWGLYSDRISVAHVVRPKEVSDFAGNNSHCLRVVISLSNGPDSPC